MTSYNELLSRLSQLHDLPVSEEMLGAYCEGTLGDADASAVADSLSSDAELSALVDSIDSLQAQDDATPFDYNPAMMDDIVLPDVPTTYEVNPFGIDDIPETGDFGMVAAAAAPIFCGVNDGFSDADDFLSSDDDSFQSEDNSLDMENDINSDDSFDDLNIQ